MDEFPEDYEDDDDDDFDDVSYLTEDELYEKHRNDIRYEIACQLKCPQSAVTEEMVTEVEKRGWSVDDDTPYCLTCGCEIRATLEQMPKRKFCGFCRAGLN